MIRRLAQRRKLVAGGCIFAAVVIGVACTGVVHATQFDVSVQAAGDQVVTSSSEWSWTASDGDIAKTPPLGIGQEVIRGGYSGSVLVAGPAEYSGNRALSQDNVIGFYTSQEMKSQAPGTFSETLFVSSVGSPAAGVSCGTDSLDDKGANFTKTAYCEQTGVSNLFMTDALDYHSSGFINQGDIEIPDTLAMESVATGSGSGVFSAYSKSLIGIGNTTELGYLHSASERVETGGTFVMKGSIRWSSFT